MKLKNQLLLGVFITILLCTLPAGKPVTVAAKKAAKEYVNKLKSNVQLTDSQTLVIEQYAAEYFTANVSANSLTDKNAKYVQKGQIFQQFNAQLDSILTPAQRGQIKTNIEQTKHQALEMDKQITN